VLIGWTFGEFSKSPLWYWLPKYCAWFSPAPSPLRVDDPVVPPSRAPRESALFQVHCCHSSLPGRYASAAYTPVCGGTTGNMPRIPGGRGCFGMRRYASVWFTREVRVLARNVTVRHA